MNVSKSEPKGFPYDIGGRLVTAEQDFCCRSKALNTFSYLHSIQSRQANIKQNQLAESTRDSALLPFGRLPAHPRLRPPQKQPSVGGVSGRTGETVQNRRPPISSSVAASLTPQSSLGRPWGGGDIALLH